MKKFFALSVVSVALLGCDNATETPVATSTTQTVATLEVSNSGQIARPDTLLSFSLNELGVTSGPLQVWQGDKAQASQLVDDDADGTPDRLVFMTDLDAAATQSYVINRDAANTAFDARAQAEVSIKEGGAWQDQVYVGGVFRNVDHVTTPPQYTDHSEFIRYEGPGIESDVIAYRIYLDWRNGFDIFGKKTPGLVLQDVGQDGYQSYHEMSDWGADILKVGQSLGMGGFGYWDGSKSVLVSDVESRSVTIHSSGPIHSSLRIEYLGWNTGDGTVDLKATLAMQPGSPFVDVDLVTSSPLDNIAIGIVAHPGTELLMGDLDIPGEAWSYMATFGEQTLFDGSLGMAVLFRKADMAKQARDENSHVLVMNPRGTRLSYAFGALWSEAEGGIQSSDELQAFLERTVEDRTIPPRVNLKTEASDKIASLDALEVARQLATSEIQRRGDSLSFDRWDFLRGQDSKWRYTTGLLMEAMDDVSQATGDSQYADYARDTIDSYITDEGSVRTYNAEDYNIDDINSGKMLQRLYARHGNDKYRTAIEQLAATLEDHPRTSDGALWHKLRYPHQLWLDGVYMGMPFLAGVGVMQGDHEKLVEAVNEFSVARARLRDAGTGLYYHAWDEAREQEWADPDTGRSPHFWSRGLGWYAMALVDMLDIIPAENAELRQPLLDMIAELADSLVAVQDATGTWFQVLDMPNEPGNYREASGTAMFTYFLAKALNKGYLPETYRSATELAFNGLVNEFVSIDAEGAFHLTNICQTAGLGYGRDGSFQYYMSEKVVRNDPKGLAPALMALLQIHELIN